MECVQKTDVTHPSFLLSIFALLTQFSFSHAWWDTVSSSKNIFKRCERKRKGWCVSKIALLVNSCEPSPKKIITVLSLTWFLIGPLEISQSYSPWEAG